MRYLVWMTLAGAESESGREPGISGKTPLGITSQRRRLVLIAVAAAGAKSGLCVGQEGALEGLGRYFLPVEY